MRKGEKGLRSQSESMERAVWNANFLTWPRADLVTTWKRVHRPRRRDSACELKTEKQAEQKDFIQVPTARVHKKACVRVCTEEEEWERPDCPSINGRVLKYMVTQPYHERLHSMHTYTRVDTHVSMWNECQTKWEGSKWLTLCLWEKLNIKYINVF